MKTTPEIVHRLRQAVQRERLLSTAKKLVAVPSWTGDAGAVSDCLAAILSQDGFEVERPEGGHHPSPSVVVRFEGKRPGRTLEFNGHLDTVHLPFVPPSVVGENLTGSGSADMKSGIAAAVEAMRALRDTKALQAGSILFVAHDLHEAPWGFGQQLDQLIADGYVGDAVLIPESLHDHLPVAGRGSATWKVTISRPGAPIHEVHRPVHEPSVIAAGAQLIGRLGKLSEELSARTDPVAGNETVFIGQIHSGEIFNQYPQECWLEGTRRWLPGRDRREVENDFLLMTGEIEKATGTQIKTEFRFIRDAFRLDPNDSLVSAFQEANTLLAGQPLPAGPKAFVDDGNTFWGKGQVPAITHGPRAGGAHTVNEWVSIDDLVRVAQVYALTALAYCGG